MTTPKRANQVPEPLVLGIDFGTLSGRATLISTRTGAELAAVVQPYRRAVIDQSLPGSRRALKHDSALQDPHDYLRILTQAVPDLMRRARIEPGRVVGIGVDFTSSTILPATADGRALCQLPRWRSNPHAWVKLWKHHAAQPEADHINATGNSRNEPFLRAYGGRYSSEWMVAKILETLREAPAVYAAADRFIEAGDWIVWQLTGREARCVSAAGFKAMRVHPDGQDGWTYPPQDFFRALDGRLAHVQTKFEAPHVGLGTRVGGLTPTMARAMGLQPGTCVAAANIDAHAAVPACGVTAPGSLVMITGTSTCHLLVADTQHFVEGICGVVRDGVIPGYWGYEAGQSGVGDMLSWYVDQALPAAAARAARKAGLDAYSWLEAEAGRVPPGASGLLALDWWNGNRSVLVDANLSGLLLGMTLATRPGEIYRALMEATAFGTRMILETFDSNGIAIDRIHACGGLAQKNATLMQIYADITGRPIRVAASEQTCALGAAMFAAVAAGVFPDIAAAARRMATPTARLYRPNRRHQDVYDRLFREYRRLHDTLGRDPASPIKVLRALRSECARRT